MVDISAESLVATAMFFSSSPEVFFDDLRPAKEWKQAFVDTEKEGWAYLCSTTSLPRMRWRKGLILWAVAQI